MGAKVEGREKAMEAIRNRGQVLGFLRGRVGARHDVVVGYTQNYALYVHENLEARHKPGKQAKYLEQPLRAMRDELLEQVARDTPMIGFEKALLRAGLRLQRASQQIVPVDTGALRASAFTSLV